MEFGVFGAIDFYTVEIWGTTLLVHDELNLSAGGTGLGGPIIIRSFPYRMD